MYLVFEKYGLKPLSTDSCLELSKIEALKMLDLQTKSTIKSNNLQEQH